jgi:hypothetical protein
MYLIMQPGDVDRFHDSGSTLLRESARPWSRREELNTPSADYKSAALTLSYTGVVKHYAGTLQ